MEIVNMDKGNRVRVDEESVLARFADWHAHIKGRPVAAIGPETRDATLFVEDEVIIDGDDQRLVEELKARYGAEVVPEAPLPPIPELLQRERRIELDVMPQAIRLRFAAPPRIDDMIPLLEQAIAEGNTRQEDIIVTSEMGAAVAAIAVRYALAGRSIGLNTFGQTLNMPLSTSQEGPVPGVGNNPFTWQAFTGRTRMIEAWQLIDSIRQVRGNRFITLGILDSGFWVDNSGVPFVAPGQPVSDFGGAFMQLNLQNEGTPVGGMNQGGSAWHGNAVSSAAAGALNNSAGAAGSGGTVAVPMFFRTDISIDQMLRCARICAAWGIDVLNMSIGTWGQTELWFPTSLWDRTFQFAFDNGVVMIAAAGNNTLNLPDDRNIRPATRTPGVLTVGALDAADNAAGFSNYGSSVWLWAPGTSIPVAPDGVSPAGSQVSGTSFASPLVAGVAAMMRFANDSLSAPEIQRLLIDTGWNGNGRVSKGLDAFAAVFAAIHQRLPDTDEPNNTIASASELLPIGPGGALVAGFGGFTSRSTNADPDYWKFRVEKFSTVTVTVDWYQRLSSLFVAVEAEDPEVRGPDDMMTVGSSQSGRIMLTGLLPPGNYRIRVGGTGLTAYRLVVTRQPATLPVDQFENNDSFEQASRMLFEIKRWTALGLRSWGPGTYDATLHEHRTFSPVIGGGTHLVMNDDYFRLQVPRNNLLQRPTISVFDADQPLDVTLYDEARTILQSWFGRHMSTPLPENTTCFLKVSANKPTRYRISTRMTVDLSMLPGPFQEELEFLPKWWGDPPPLWLKDIVTHYVVEVNENRGDGEAIAFERPAEAIMLELLNLSGEVVREAEAINGNLFIDTRGIERGTYVLRISKAEDATQSLVQLRTVPPLR